MDSLTTPPTAGTRQAFLPSEVDPTVFDEAFLRQLERLPLIPWAPGKKPYYVRISGTLSGRRIALADLPSQWWG